MLSWCARLQKRTGIILAMELVPPRTVCLLPACVSWAGTCVKGGAVKALGDVLCCSEVLVPPQ